LKGSFIDLSSPYWWVSVVIVGILINLASAYLKPKLDTRLSRASTWWRTRSEAQKSERLRKIEVLVGDANAQAVVGQEEIRLRLKAMFSKIDTLFFLAFAIFCNVVYPTSPAAARGLSITVFICLVLSLMYLLSAMGALIKAAEKVDLFPKHARGRIKQTRSEKAALSINLGHWMQSKRTSAALISRCRPKGERSSVRLR
jgi:hypothetical protein